MNDSQLVDKVLEAIPKNSVGRYDLLPIVKNVKLFREIVKYLADPFLGKADYVASPEAIGWVLGTAIATELNVGFIPLRKSGRLPYPNELLISRSYIDYSRKEKSLEIKKDSIARGDRILIVDEWVETGTTMKCCIELLEKAGGTIAGLATIGIDYREQTKDWIDTGFIRFIGTDIE